MVVVLDVVAGCSEGGGSGYSMLLEVVVVA